MSMDVVRARQTLRKQLNQAWNELRASVNKMAAGCDVRPNDFKQIFKIEDEGDNSIKVTVGPVAFLLKERAQSDKSDMYVVVNGRLNFSIDGGMDPPLACFFQSSVGYFLKAGAGKVDHVLGVHYDFDQKTAGHPIFHAQIMPCLDGLEAINEHYRPVVAIKNNRMDMVAKKVRLPTAHMDPLAVFVQLLADHLLNENSGPGETGAFERARTALMFFKSDPARAKRLDAVRAEDCFRGPRWYPEDRPVMPPVPVNAQATA